MRRGNYCTWNEARQRLISMEKSNDDELTDAEKAAASFSTSMNGSITQIPVGYTVEVRGLLAGTQFQVVERPWEIPDGYSFQKYVYKGEPLNDAAEGVRDTVAVSQDPHVDVCNLRGWGLRVYKNWPDTDYMSEREDTYFAVYTDNGSGNLALVEGTVRRLKQKETTLYWYFLPLPHPEIPFNNYLIREVTITNPTVNEEGEVTAYDDSVVPIDHNGEVRLSGKQKGETASSEFTYTVLYDKGEVATDSNVRVDTVTNNRPGIVLKKQVWNGNALAGAAFTLTDSDGNAIGSFVSDADGQITVAFLRDNVDYTLTETRTPQGYHGLEAPMIIRLSNGTVAVSGVDENCYSLTQGAGATPTLTVKNRPFTFRAVKVDGSSGSPLANVHFALHRQVTVDGVTTVETTPMAGFEDLVTDSSGLVPRLTEALAPGTYELREKAALAGYQKLTAYIRFTISPTGAVTLGSSPDGVTLEGTAQADGTLAYQMTIPNDSYATLTVSKTVTGGMADWSKPFTFTLAVEGSESGQTYQLVKNGTTSTISSNGTFTQAHGESAVITLPMNKEITISEQNEDYTASWALNGGEKTKASVWTGALTDTSGAALAFENDLSQDIPTGITLNALPYWLLLALGVGLALTLILLRGRNREHD